MAQTKLKGVTVNTNGDLPKIGSSAIPFKLTAIDLKEITLSDFSEKNLILNIFPSIDTSTCATSVREFNKRASSLPDTVVLCISKDLPFAHRRFCGAEGIDKVISLSDYRNEGFSKDYGLNLLMEILKAWMHAPLWSLTKKAKLCTQSWFHPLVMNQIMNRRLTLYKMCDLRCVVGNVFSNGDQCLLHIEPA